MTSDLLPCPFCGDGKTEIVENGRIWNGVKGYGAPTSVSVRHWCCKQEGQPTPRMIERVGRDEPSAIAAWNTRPAPAGMAEIVAAAEAWVKAATYRASDQFCSAEDINDADENLTAAPHEKREG